MAENFCCSYFLAIMENSTTYSQGYGYLNLDLFPYDRFPELKLLSKKL